MLTLSIHIWSKMYEGMRFIVFTCTSKLSTMTGSYMLYKYNAEWAKEQMNKMLFSLVTMEGG